MSNKELIMVKAKRKLKRQAGNIWFRKKEGETFMVPRKVAETWEQKGIIEIIGD